MKQCSRCNQSKPLDAFYNAKRFVDGKQHACKECMAESYNRSRNAKKDHYEAVRKQRVTNNRMFVKEWKEQQGCLVCDERVSCCLELHHLDPKQKDIDPSALVAVSIDAFLKEASKCVVLCANCHRKVHAGLLELKDWV